MAIKIDNRLHKLRAECAGNYRVEPISPQRQVELEQVRPPPGEGHSRVGGRQ
ncbi:A disintegrin and metalloproteinase with thrombospondin motifs 10 [Clarias magur]|uniref:A disintegrin and metalloproteinase with thrombospondin motifs 10 n=1 Tax=Clarias magur TaxID=1594786 RepID=A0A8J4XE34_CLAMG|nr:A disintegrin and metalloproteinase with thrombospondin motifs 10 [Clarias magur]